MGSISRNIHPHFILDFTDKLIELLFLFLSFTPFFFCYSFIRFLFEYFTCTGLPHLTLETLFIFIYLRLFYGLLQGSGYGATVILYYSYIQLLNTFRLTEFTNIQQLDVTIVQYYNYTTGFSHYKYH